MQVRHVGEIRREDNRQWCRVIEQLNQVNDRIRVPGDDEERRYRQELGDQPSRSTLQ